MAYSPKHNYRAKDQLERGDPNKIVRGFELSEDFEAISREVADISYQLGDLQVNVGGGMNLDDLNDVSAALPDRDNLIIWNGTQWVSDNFGFIETTLTFQGGYDLTSTAPADPQDGDLYISNTDGAVDASWGPIGGTPVVAGNVVGYAESKGRWYLLGDLASTAVTSVGEGLGISVEDSKPREPVVGINRDDVDEWYADKEATENRFVDIETNITEIEGDITDIKTDIGDLEVNIENNLQGNYEPKIDPKNTAFNKNFGTNVGEVAQGNHDHNTLYEPIITPKNSAFNKAFGTAAGQVAQGNHNHSGVYEPVINPKNSAFNKNFGTASGTVSQGNHNHDAVYLKDAPKDGSPYQRQDGAWVKAAGGGGGGGGSAIKAEWLGEDGESLIWWLDYRDPVETPWAYRIDPITDNFYGRAGIVSTDGVSHLHEITTSKLTARSIVTIVDSMDGNTPDSNCVQTGTVWAGNTHSIESEVYGGINILGADAERPPELPYSPEEKSIQYALTVTHETLGRTVEIDKEGIIRANQFTDMAGNPMSVSPATMVDAFTTLQTAIADEDTLEGVKTALTNALGGLIEKFEAYQVKQGIEK